MNIDFDVLRDRLRFRLKICFYIVLCCLIAAAFGFFYFQYVVVERFDSDSCEMNQIEADAIVVITGGHGRIQQGLKLLDEKKALKILISGVHEDFSKKSLERESEDIILGYMATNTEENANEARIFMALHGFKKMILVTNSAHMPRASFLFNYIMPDIKVIKCSVKSKDSFTSSFVEYSKYLTTYIIYNIDFARNIYSNYLRTKLAALR